MEYNVSLAKCDEIILNFLKQNGFNDDAEIIRYFIENEKPIVYLKDTVDYHGDKIPRLTKLTKYEALLKGILKSRGKEVLRVEAVLNPYSL